MDQKLPLFRLNEEIKIFSILLKYARILETKRDFRGIKSVYEEINYSQRERDQKGKIMIFIRSCYCLFSMIVFHVYIIRILNLCQVL